MYNNIIFRGSKNIEDFYNILMDSDSLSYSYTLLNKRESYCYHKEVESLSLDFSLDIAEGCSFCDNTSLYEEQVDKMKELDSAIGTYNYHVSEAMTLIGELTESLDLDYILDSLRFIFSNHMLNKIYDDYVSINGIDALKDLYRCVDDEIYKFLDNNLVFTQEEVKGKMSTLVDHVQELEKIGKDIEGHIKDISEISGEDCPGDEDGEDQCSGEESVDKNAKEASSEDLMVLNGGLDDYVRDIESVWEILFEYRENLDKEVKDLLTHWIHRLNN